MKHVFEDRSRPYTFLPINLRASSPWVHMPKLAVVDTSFAESHATLHTMLWKSAKATGTISRAYSDRTQRNEDGTLLRCSEQLAHAVLGVPPYSPSYAKNADPLDCRKDNLALAAHLPAARQHIAEYKPGSVVSQLPGYNEALNAVTLFPEIHSVILSTRRTGKLTSAQLLELLNEALSGQMKGQSVASITGWAEDRFNTCLHVNHVRAFLKGQVLPQPGFDYKALAATRPSPRERALERWKQRQLEARP